MTPQPAPQAAPPPASQLLQISIGYWLSRALHIAAELKIADHLANGARSVAELAAATSTHPDGLYRILRALASAGVFSETGERQFELSPLAEPLRSDVPGSVHPLVVFMGDHWHWKAYGEMMHSVRTGKPSFDAVFGQPIFEYFASHAEDARVFDDAMKANSEMASTAVAQAYDFTGFGTIVDIAGGTGLLLSAALKAAPHARGILFDLPHVIERARAKAMLPSERSEMVPGDFFQAVPDGADAYLMKHIIHDWADEPAGRILQVCRKSMRPESKLLVVEMVVPPGNEPSLSKMIDLEMLVAAGGRERTEREYSSLLTKAGFQINRIVGTVSPVSVIEASPV